MAVTTQSGVPCKIQSGDTIIFEITNADYSPSTHSAIIYFSRNGSAVLNVSGTESGSAYTFTLTAAQTAALAPGTHQWLIRYTVTADSTVETGESGIVAVLPNLAASQTASTAQALLTLLEAQLTTLMTSGDTYTSVSFNGQSYTKRDLTTLIPMRDNLRAEVIREKRAAALAAGRNDGRNFAIRFGQSGGC